MSLCNSWFFAVRAAVQRGASHSSSRLKGEDSHQYSLLHYISLSHTHTHTQRWPFQLIGKNLLQKVGVWGEIISEALQLDHSLLQFNKKEKKKHNKWLITRKHHEQAHTTSLSKNHLPALWQCPLWCFGVTAESCPPGGARRLRSHVDTEKTTKRRITDLRSYTEYHTFHT